MTCRQNLSLEDGTKYCEKAFTDFNYHHSLPGLEGTGSPDRYSQQSPHPF